MRPAGVVALAFLVAAGVIVSLTLIRREPPRDGLTVPAREVEPDLQSPGPGEPRGTGSATEPVAKRPAPESALSALRSYFGPDFDSALQRLNAHPSFVGQDWTTTPPPIPWEEAAAHFESELVEWPEWKTDRQRQFLSQGNPADLSWLQRQVGAEHRLTPLDAAEIEATCADSQRRIEELARAMTDMAADARRRKWAAGQFLRAPYSTAALEGGDRAIPNAIWTSGSGHGGWAVSMWLVPEDVPGWAELDRELQRWIVERDHRILAWVKAH